LTQEVMSVVFSEIDKFEHNGRVGAFRNWLRLITLNRCKHFFRIRKKEPQGVGGSVFSNVINELADPKSELSCSFDREHDLFVLQRLLQLVASEFEPQTMRAFQLYVVEGRDAAAVASKMKVSQQVAYIAKSRVMRRLREVAPDLMEDLECRVA
ncbi:MAG: sigma-70 family RNA polymerase sigma factor, partial [Planctomycetota bacterium]